MLIRLSVLLVLLLTAGAAGAQSSKWYGLIGSGFTNAEPATSRAQSDAALAAQGFTSIFSHDPDAGAPLMLGIGYALTPRLALEASYVDLNDIANYSATFRQGVNSGSSVQAWKASGLELAAIGNWPMNHELALLAKAGAYFLEGDFTTQTEVRAPGGTLLSRTASSSSESAAVPSIGVGVALAFTDRLSVRAMLELLGKADVFGAGNDLKDVRLISVAATYRF